MADEESKEQVKQGEALNPMVMYGGISISPAEYMEKIEAVIAKYNEFQSEEARAAYCMMIAERLPEEMPTTRAVYANVQKREGIRYEIVYFTNHCKERLKRAADELYSACLAARYGKWLCNYWHDRYSGKILARSFPMLTNYAFVAEKQAEQLEEDLRSVIREIQQEAEATRKRFIPPLHEDDDLPF